MIKKIPFVFQNVVRKRYFEIIKIFIEDADLILDLDNYKYDVIIDHRCFGSGIVAIIESHSVWGEPDDLTNESKKREYDGLKISVKDSRFRVLIEQIADKIKRNIQEDVIVA